jgi:hypothetical protein
MILPDDVSSPVPETKTETTDPAVDQLERLVSAAELIRDTFEKCPELEKLYDSQFQLLLAEMAKVTKGA